MLNLTEMARNAILSSIDGSPMTICGEEFKIRLEKVIEKQILSLSDIVGFVPNSNDKGKNIEAYDNYYAGSKKYKRPIFLLACLYIFKQSVTAKEKEKEAKQLMLDFFSVENMAVFSSTVKEFKDFYKNVNLTSVSKQVKDIFNTYSAFNDFILFRIIVFAYYHPFDFEIEIDIPENFNFLNIKEAPADAPF